MDSLNAYAQAFEKSLACRQAFTNFNRDIQHATVIVCLAFGYAEKTVRLLSQKLDPMLYGTPWFREEAEGFLKKGGRLNVLVETPLPKDHPIFSLASEFPGLLAIRLVRDSKPYTFNFMLVDEIGYRFETDRRNPEAIVFFNHPEATETIATLKQRFDGMWENATALDASATNT